MPKIENWGNLPEGIRQHLIDRMQHRAISIADLNQLRLWIESRPEVPDGDWYNWQTWQTGFHRGFRANVERQR
jgi:hypothetical protein